MFPLSKKVSTQSEEPNSWPLCGRTTLTWGIVATDTAEAEDDDDAVCEGTEKGKKKKVESYSGMDCVALENV